MSERSKYIQSLVEKIERAYDCEFNEGIDWAANFGEENNKFFEEFRNIIEENGYEDTTPEQEAQLITMSLKA